MSNNWKEDFFVVDCVLHFFGCMIRIVIRFSYFLKNLRNLKISLRSAIPNIRHDLICMHFVPCPFVAARTDGSERDQNKSSSKPVTPAHTPLGVARRLSMDSGESMLSTVTPDAPSAEITSSVMINEQVLPLTTASNLASNDVDETVVGGTCESTDVCQLNRDKAANDSEVRRFVVPRMDASFENFDGPSMAAQRATSEPAANDSAPLAVNAKFVVHASDVVIRKNPSTPKKNSTKNHLAQSKSETVQRSRKKQRKSEEIWICGACNYTYGDSDDPLIADDWYICSKCSKKFHESCGVRRGRKRVFYCHSC